MNAPMAGLLHHTDDAAPAENADVPLLRSAEQRIDASVPDTCPQAADPTPIQPLLHFLDQHHATLGAAPWNEIACQVMNLHHALRGDHTRSVDHALKHWLIDPQSRQVIIPWSQSVSLPGDQRAQILLSDWTECTARWDRSPIKPAKQPYGSKAQARLQKTLQRWLEKNLFAAPGVVRVHLMGAALREDMGHYEQPYVTDLGIKLGSDVDLLIEVDEDAEQSLPPSWRCIYEETSQSGCAFYELGELAMQDGVDSAHRARFPSIPFQSHLLAAYVFFPSRCSAAQKDAFLHTYGGKQIHQREGAAAPRPAREGIEQIIDAHYALSNAQIDPQHAGSDSRLYRVDSQEQQAIFKISTGAGTYHYRRLREHARYEVQLIGLLRARGIDTPAVIPARDGLTVPVGEHEGILFERFSETPLDRPEYPIDAAARALVAIHAVQIDAPLDIDRSFRYEDHLGLWMKHFERSRQSDQLPAELRLACDVFAPLAQHYHIEGRCDWLIAQSVRLHCHGDVKPRNSIVSASGEVRYFDFDNAMYAPRLSDVVDGAISFALAEQFIEQADFSRCAAFIAAYCAHASLTRAELACLDQWLEFGTLVQFTRELASWVGTGDEIRHGRALALASFIAGRRPIAGYVAQP